ncbi:MAG: glycosyltransferase family 4 protein [Microthrixaceae bacterium]|nr:glycosyltransferase family 4 protein [Microthrixaceae bacterium]
MLAWRDLDDDEAGGSEVHAHNIASIWTQSGLHVTMRTSAAIGLPSSDVRDGYSVSRKAGRYGVFVRSPLSEIAGRLGPCDALVEIWNGMPFLSPLWWRGPRAIWLHHVHGPMWGMTLGKSLAWVGDSIESRIAPPLYRGQPIVTLSESSRQEIIEELKVPRDNVSVIMPGVDPYFTPGGAKSSTPLAVAVGRLVPVKDFHRLVRIVARVHEAVPDFELVIVGEGYERDSITQLIGELGAESYIRLAGRVTDEELRDLYRRSWMAVSASIREGWGMTLTEAAACGTPSVATDIAGHFDAVAADKSGILGTSDDELVAAMVSVATDRDLRARLTEGALERAAELTWEHAAVANFEVLAADAARRLGR